MSSRCLDVLRCTALLLALPMAGCERETRRFDTPPKATDRAGPGAAVRAGPFASAPGGPDAQARSMSHVPPQPPPGYEENAFAVAQGKRWYRWFNCNGCHANGGGGMGPALIDVTWRYGRQPGDIAETILQGRPNGMPSFAGRLNEEQLWQLTAYVRSMSGQLRADVAPSRSDALSAGEPESRRETQRPGRR